MSISENFGCFYFWAIVNNAAMNISVQISIWVPDFQFYWEYIYILLWKWKSLSRVQIFVTPPWTSTGQNTGVGSLCFLQRIFPTQGWNILLYRMIILFLIVWGTTMLFSILCFHQQCTSVLISPHPHQELLFSFFLIVVIFMDIKWYLIVALIEFH